MDGAPAISLIVPTRRRTPQLRRFLDSLAATASRPHDLEIILVLDEDDEETLAFRYEGLPVRRAVVAPGLTMGGLNMAGYEASSGRYLMLLNDDVVARTRGWDERALEAFAGFPDGVALVHVNDLMFRDSLCTFPFVSRTYCELAGGICPRGYARYRIDDHLVNVFNLLGLLDERRIVYLPEVVFEHFHFEEDKTGDRRYVFDEATMAHDAPLFEALQPERNALALRLKEHIEAQARQAARAAYRDKLAQAEHPFKLFAPGRLRVHTDCPDPARARVAVGVVLAGPADVVEGDCLEALRAYSPEAELVVLEAERAADCRPGREWNRLLGMTRADYLVLTDGRSHVAPGWLEALLRGVRGGAAAVVPLQQDEAGRPLYAAIAAPADDSASPELPRPLATLLGDCFLVDVARCRALLFDERYHRYFADLDFGLRLWEAGQRVVSAPGALVTRRGERTPNGGPASLQKLFDQDRGLFAVTWVASGRCDALGERLGEALRELRRLLDLGPDALRLLRREGRETLAAYRQRAGRVYGELRHYPILPRMLSGAAVQMLAGATPDVRDPRTGHLACLLSLTG
jgi:GT2 family glycosyltransferase